LKTRGVVYIYIERERECGYAVRRKIFSALISNGKKEKVSRSKNKIDICFGGFAVVDNIIVISIHPRTRQKQKKTNAKSITLYCRLNKADGWEG